MKNKVLADQDILDNFHKLITTQTYKKAEKIAGVEFFELKKFNSETGFFAELCRLGENNSIEMLPDFEIKQISISSVLPGAIKAWHLHFKQDDLIFSDPDSYMNLGLVDLRKNSETKDVRMKIVLGGGKAQFVLIPRGVAHGYQNFGSVSSYVVYFTNQKFNGDNPDEKRLPFDSLGDDFWQLRDK